MRWSWLLLLAGFAGWVAFAGPARAQNGAAPQWAIGGEDADSGCDGDDCDAQGSGGPGAVHSPIGAMVPGPRDFRQRMDENTTRLRQEMEERSRQDRERREELQGQAQQRQEDEEQGEPTGIYRMPALPGLMPGINPGQTAASPAQDDGADQPQ